MVDQWVYAPGTKRRVKVGGPTYKSWSAAEKAKAEKAPAPKKAGSAVKAPAKKKAGSGGKAKKTVEKKTVEKKAKKTPTKRTKTIKVAKAKVSKTPAPMAVQTAAEKAACECPPAFKSSKSKSTGYWVYHSCDAGCKGKGVWRVSATSHREAVKKILDFIAFQLNYVAGSEEFWAALGYDGDLRAEWKGSVDESIGDAKTASKWIRRMMVPFTVKGQYDFDPFANFNPQEIVTFVVVISTPETDEFMKYLARGKAYEDKSTPKALSPQKIPPPQEESKGWFSFLPKVNIWS